MSRKKLKRFAEVKDSDFVLENSQPRFKTIKDNWKKEIGFKPPFVLELGCGAGEYTVGIAEKFPEKNVVGVDIKGERIWKGVQKIKEKELKNAFFIRSQIDHIQNFFSKKSIAEIWITFPDPRIKNKDERRRLTSLKFLSIYAPLMVDGGIINLKTDSRELYDYTLSLMGREIISTFSNCTESKKYKIELVQSTDDLYNSKLLEKVYEVQTRYEKKFLAEGKTIKLLSFRFDLISSIF